MTKWIENLKAIIAPLGTNFSEILNKIQLFWYSKNNFNMKSAKYATISSDNGLVVPWGSCH